MKTDTFDVGTLRLWKLTQHVCKNIGHARLVRVENLSENIFGKKKVLYIRWDSQEVVIPITNILLDTRDDETLMTYLIWAIMHVF
jgi:hypothetical protein